MCFLGVNTAGSLAGLALVPRLFFNESRVAPPAWSCTSWLPTPSRTLLTCTRLCGENHIQRPSNMGVQSPGSWSRLGNFWKIQTFRSLCVLGWTCFKSIFDANCVNPLFLPQTAARKACFIKWRANSNPRLRLPVKPRYAEFSKRYEIRWDLELGKWLLHWERVSPGTEGKPHLSLERWDGEIVDGMH